LEEKTKYPTRHLEENELDTLSIWVKPN